MTDDELSDAILPRVGIWPGGVVQFRGACQAALRGKLRAETFSTESSVSPNVWADELYALILKAPDIAISGGPVYMGEYRVTIERRT